MFDLWLKTLGDLKEPKILIRVLIPFAAAIVLVSLLAYGVFGVMIFSDWVTQNPMVMMMSDWTQNAENMLGSIPLIGGVLVWTIGLIVSLIAGVVGFLLGSYLILIFAMIITGFMTDSLVKAVRDIHYPALEYQGHGGVLQMLWKLLKYGLFILLLFIVTIPMLFIPIVNVVWFWLLGFLFFRYSIVLDVGQVILPKALYEQTKSSTNWTPSLALAGIFSLSLMPLMGLIVPVLAVLAMAHYNFDVLTQNTEKEV